MPINRNIGYYGQTTRNNVNKYCSQNKVASVNYVSIFTNRKENYDFRYFKERNCKNYVLGDIGRVKHLIRLQIRTILFVHEHTVFTILFISLGRLNPYKFDNYLRFEIFCFWPSQTWLVCLWIVYYSKTSFCKLTRVLYPCGTQVKLKGRIKVFFRYLFLKGKLWVCSLPSYNTPTNVTSEHFTRLFLQKVQ